MYFKSSSEKSSKVYYLGEYNSGEEVNVASKYAGYGNLKNSNFILMPSVVNEGNMVGNNTNGLILGQTCVQSVDWQDYRYSEVYGKVTADSVTCSGSYNSSTGKLTITANFKATVYGSTQNTNASFKYLAKKAQGTGTMKVKVYLVDGTIEDL